MLPAGGESTTHLCVSASSRLVLACNYNGGTLTAFALEGDELALSAQPVYQESFGPGSGVVPDRQDASHPHGSWLYAGGRFALVSDLGADTLYVYQVDPSGPSLLRMPLDVDVGPGTGPRHAVVDEQAGLVYLVCELQPLVKVRKRYIKIICFLRCSQPLLNILRRTVGLFIRLV